MVPFPDGHGRLNMSRMDDYCAFEGTFNLDVYGSMRTLSLGILLMTNQTCFKEEQAIIDKELKAMATGKRHRV